MKPLSPLKNRRIAIGLLFVVLTILGSLGVSQPVDAQTRDGDLGVFGQEPYFTEVTLGNTSEIEGIIIHGPPHPPVGYARETLTENEMLAGAGIVLLPVPTFDWLFGCSATSGAMIAAYYDRNGYPNMYTGPTNGGVMPLTDTSWPLWTDGTGSTYRQCPLTASHNGLDGRVTRGSIDDHWVGYGSGAADPFITNGWVEHTYGEAIGDYMRTSQSNFGNTDASTTFYTYTSYAGELTCADMVDYGITHDGTYGRMLFYQAKGYTVTNCYNQRTDNNNGGGFTLAMYQAEIDAGRPVMLNLVGHTVVGVGYDDANSTIYIHDTWDYLNHSFTWGGSYSGMALQSVSIVNLGTVIPNTLTVARTGTGSGTVTSDPAGINCGSDCTEDYTLNTVVTLTAAASTDSTFTGWSGSGCSGTGTCVVTMDAAKSVTANFDLLCYPLVLSVNPVAGGGVNADPLPNCTSGTQYTVGTNVSLSAVAAEGYTFTGWSGGASGTSNPVVVGMNAAKTVTANFTLLCYTLTLAVNPIGSGVVSAEPGTNCAGGKYTHGSVVSVSVVPVAGYGLSGWSGSVSGDENPVEVVMNGERSVTANLGLLAAGFGKYYPADGAVGRSTATTLSWLVSSGLDGYEYCLDTVDNDVCDTGWVGTGLVRNAPQSGLAGNTTYSWQVRAVNVNGEVEANGGTWWQFTTVPCYTLTTIASPGGGGSVGVDAAPNCAGGRYSAGTVLHLTATPAVGYGFVNWSGDGSGSTNPLTVTMTRDKTVRANFVESLPGGFAKYYPTDGAVGRSTATTLTWLTSARAEWYEYCIDTEDNDLCDTGWVETGLVRNALQSGMAGNTTYYWQVVAWNVNGEVEANGGTWWQFTTGPCYTLNTGVTPGGGGSVGVDVLPNCAGGRYSAGTVLHLTAIPAAHYTFLNWSGDGSGSTNPLTVTMTRNKTVTGLFLVDAPEGFVKYYPADGAVGRSTVTTLSWLASVRAEGYEYCLDTEDNDLCDTSWVGTGLVRNAPQSGLAGSTTYYWQVRAVNPGGATEANGGNWWQFTTGPCYSLNTGVNPGGGGSVGRDVLPNCAGGSYSAGTVLHLTAVPAGGYGFVNWSGDGSGSTNPLTVTMTRNKTVTANFLP